jgi:predicted permease
VLSFAGAAAGLGLGLLGLRMLIAFSGTQIPGSPSATIHLPVLMFTLALAVLTGVVFGLTPGLTLLRGNAAAFLKDDSTRGTPGKRAGATRAALVIAETAIAVVLLIGAGLLIKSFARLQRVDPGFSSDNVLTAQIALPAARYPNETTRIAFWDRLIDRVRTIPGVTAAGLTTNVPFNGMVGSGSYTIVGRPLAPGEAMPHGRQEVVGGDYFTAMQIPLVTGRLFADTDTASTETVCVIDDYLMKKYFTDRSPIGEQIQRGPAFRATIVGVVRSINSIDLGQPVTKERIYFAARQQAPRAMAIVIKTGLDPLTLVPQARAVVQAIDPEQPIADVRTMDQWMSRSLEVRRTPMALLAVFGAVALTLAAIGIYGVLAFGVAQRRREIGVRQALGADSGSILTLVLVEGLRTAGLGTALGLLAALALARSLQSLLFGVTTHDPTIFAGVATILLLVAAAACFIPARRATKIDPMVALRES